jgi:hypothetical protein
MTNNRKLALALIVAVGGPACSSRKDYRSPGPVKAQVEYKMDAAEFDLETVVGLLKTKQVKDAEELQKKINDPASGINNVDLDGDKMVDFVTVKEERHSDSQRQLDFLAFPSSKGGADPTPIASVSFQVGQDSQQLTVVGAYPSYVNGYASSNYVYTVPYTGPSFGEMLFLSWMFSPRPVYMYAPYHTFGYRPYGVMASSSLVTRRTSYRTEARVAPVQRQAPPAGAAPRFATQAESRFKPSAGAAPNSLSSSGKSAQGFGVRDPGKGKPTATGFGAPAGAGAPSAGSSFSKPSTPPPSGSSWGARPSTPPSSPSSSPSSGSSFSARPSAPSSNWGASRPSGSSSFGSRSSSSSGKRR